MKQRHTNNPDSLFVPICEPFRSAIFNAAVLDLLVSICYLYTFHMLHVIFCASDEKKVVKMCKFDRKKNEHGEEITSSMPIKENKTQKAKWGFLSWTRKYDTSNSILILVITLLLKIFFKSLDLICTEKSSDITQPLSCKYNDWIKRNLLLSKLFRTVPIMAIRWGITCRTLWHVMVPSQWWHRDC